MGTPANLLLGIVQGAPPGVLGVDSDSPLSFATAKALHDLGYRFCARYLSLGSSQAPGDLSSQEAADILRAGLSLVPVQHVLKAGWSPSGDLGTRHGQAAHDNAVNLGIPPGVNLWCDLEGCAHNTSHQAIIDYCNAWFEAVEDQDAGYIPGLYVGFDAFLSSEELYGALRFQHYWSAPQATLVDSRGYQLLQLLPLNQQLAGVYVDVDVTQQDLKKGSVQWLAPAKAPVV
ncbi:uncharacterized protein DUF1906 [Archangium gephyra]|uniref:Uncharacterized protein DUF1906 n=1 Tax=Archangium gephyra TaxID=48 RepID=A0AAC8TC61_9BACT|nr:DUF1906 domain-containing protein [Archangium gephyra]AKJ00540.1 Hypothetical protein AA314_02166 [Archangium gephyra]REG32765.1 uncharacterized protein DUF1906 [Archangium gephyra]